MQCQRLDEKWKLYHKQRDSEQKTSNPKLRIILERNTQEIFFTKHARCRMECRHITQKEVKEIILNGKVNYNKSDLNDAKGPTYALEGITSDDQHVRIIVAPKRGHLSVVTVIDLEKDFACDCD